ncbi:DUF6207 family protein [Streptomyces hydrogenans]|uniref:DUF6207 family protein n=1 Tax=Streptomyces hydrogenans TaxID=1873719 RepID=UPI0033F54E30
MEPVDPVHLAVPGLLVLDITAPDKATLRTAAEHLGRHWATSGTPTARRTPGEPGVTGRLYADLRRPGTAPGPGSG